MKKEIEGNELIAERKHLKLVEDFMGYADGYLPQKIRWNDVMPVVDKVESIYDDFHGYFGVHIYSNACTIQGTKLRTDPENFHPAYLSDPNAILNTKIESTWYNIVQFINWYNKNQRQP